MSFDSSTLEPVKVGSVVFGPSPLQQLLQGARERPPSQSGAGSGATIGKLAGFSAARLPLVQLPGNEQPIEARCACGLSAGDVGREAVLVFEANEPKKPIIIGLLQETPVGDSEPVIASLDGEEIVLTAQKEIVLRCGKASITLTRAGKVLIRGAYISSRSSGAHRIKGGSVQIN
ncbi:MAG TPA: DUF6484 domain-containing protein [Candidatus Dormibacteraeota bacterium]|nr:DUF6484 domain-containing protein [Candidatus Dormibacteraeota bacterium]